MGFVEDIEQLDLSDEVKQNLLNSHNGEVDPLRQENETLSAISNRENVEAEVTKLGAMFSDAPETAPVAGLLKFYRRCLLSKNASEPGAVLLSDKELGLSGETATGATGREETSVAGALRNFVSLMSDSEGKLLVQFSDQAHREDGNHHRPDNGENDSLEEKERKRKEAASRLAGRPIERTRRRYSGIATTSEGV